MDGYLSNKPKNFVDDPEKRYRQMRRAAQAKKFEVQKLRSKNRWNLQKKLHL
jgi:hypothetical protein